MPKVNLQNQATLTQQFLHDLLHYDPATGIFTWRVSRGAAVAGQEAGFLDASTGYRKVVIDGRRYLANRLAIFYVTGQWPPHLVDHENLSRTDNAFDNLRQASNAQNLWNQEKSAKVTGRPNASRFKGVSWDAARGRWAANISQNGTYIRLGRFASEEAAARAYDAAAVQLHGEFARLNFPIA